MPNLAPYPAHRGYFEDLLDLSTWMTSTICLHQLPRDTCATCLRTRLSDVARIVAEELRMQEEELQRLKSALSTYGAHRGDCARSDTAACSCGLDALLASIGGLQP